MRKVPPSVMVREEINRALTEGVNAGGDLLSTLTQLGFSYLLQQALEQEDFLGRGRYERQSGDSLRLDEKSAMKLVFATLIRVSERWSRVSVSELERRQLGLLRRQLGIDPPPAGERKELRRERSKVA